MIRLVSTDRRPWRCNSGQTANIATRIFHRMLWKRASALTNAHSVRTASRTSCAMYARTAAAVLSRGRSGPQRNGALDCRLRSARRRTSGCISPIAWTISPRIRRSFGIFRLRSGDDFSLSCAIVIARSGATKQSSFLCGCGLLRFARNDGIIRPAGSSPQPPQSRRGSRRPGTSRA